MIKDALPAHGLTRTAFALFFMAMLCAASFWVLHLFLTGIVWAAMIVVSTWPLMLGIQSRLWGKRSAAVAVMVLALLMTLIVPFLFAVLTVVTHADRIVGWVKALAAVSVPPPPAWVAALPLVGEKIAAQWAHVVAIGPEGISAFLVPYAGKVLDWSVTASGNVGMMIVQFLLTVFIAALFYLNGERNAAWLCRFARRVAGRHGEQSLQLAASAIRAVALGVVGTAVIQAILGGIVLLLSGIPAPGILTALLFILCLAQIGPAPVLVPAAIWLFWTGQPLWGGVLVAATIVLAIADNIIRPVLMKQGADLPVLLVFAGVTGGLLVFGVIGLFIGPVVLAVSFTLLDEWVTAELPTEEKPAPSQ